MISDIIKEAAFCIGLALAALAVVKLAGFIAEKLKDRR